MPPGLILGGILKICESLYGLVINFKNRLYKSGFLKESKTYAYVICVGNLTTGGVGKTPIVISLANSFGQEKKVAIISRGYKAKISNKYPTVIKDYEGLKFQDGSLCGDEPFQVAKKTKDNITVITCADRKKAIEFAIEKYGIDTVILDDGFSNRKIKKDKTILAIDSKMRFGNNHLLPLGPLREPVDEIERADEIILVNKGDKNIEDAILWAERFKKPLSLCRMRPYRVYNFQTGANIKKNHKKAVAFCAIGQPEQFFDFAKEFYDIIPVIFEDHHKYTKADIDKLIKIAKQNNTQNFITTQKDESKLIELTKNYTGYTFCTLELDIEIKKI